MSKLLYANFFRLWRNRLFQIGLGFMFFACNHFIPNRSIIIICTYEKGAENGTDDSDHNGIAKHSTIQFHIDTIPNKLPVLLIHKKTAGKKHKTESDLEQSVPTKPEKVCI